MNTTVPEVKTNVTGKMWTLREGNKYLRVTEIGDELYLEINGNSIQFKTEEVLLAINSALGRRLND